MKDFILFLYVLSGDFEKMIKICGNLLFLLLSGRPGTLILLEILPR